MKLFNSMRLFFVLFICLTVSGVYSQSININTVKDAVTTLAENFPLEQMYLQYDKPAYAPGETLWFKAYLTADNNTDNISKTLYIDFIDARGRLLKHCVQAVYQSSASGNFDVPLEYKDQLIYVKAYTRWMLNFDSSFLYRKAIHIIQGKPSLKENKIVIKASAQFLPEGGDLVEGIESKVAFKAISNDGKPAAIQGIVVNKSGERAATFKTVHDGMGFFLLQPKAGETYSAKWKDAAGNNYQTALPAAKPTGVTLQIKQQNDVCGFVIQRSETAPDNLKKIYIAATMQQHLIYLAAANLADNFVTGGSIPVKDLPSGIVQVTLFDSDWVATAERIAFINNDDYHFEPEAGFSELGLDKRKLNTLVINVPDTITANLSVAVTDEGVGVDSSDDIISRFLLTGDLKGAVYQPAYYFTNNSDSLKQQLDLVMLTNGWRRINWQDVVHNKMPVIKYANDTDYLKISGRVFGATDADLKQGAFILMMLDNKKDSSAHRVQQALLSNDGSFRLPAVIVFDTTKVYYKVAGNADISNSSAVTFNTGMPSLKIGSADTASNILFGDTATENFRRRLAEEQERFFKMQQGTTLQDVTVKTKVKSPLELLDEKYASALFSSDDGYQFDVVNDPFAKNAVSVFTYLQGKVAGLTISVPGSGDPSVTWRGGTPTFFLDESSVDVGTLSTINMTDVAYIKVFRPPFIGAVGGGANGAIAIYTRKGGDVTQPKSKGLPYKLIIGYTIQKEFYSPDYGSFNNDYNAQDLRSTLYWNPMILTNHENHTIRLHFYNNDITKGFRLVLEGMSTDGRFTHIEKTVE